MESSDKLRGNHYLNLYVSYELKNRLHELAAKYDRTTADIVRSIIKIGIPMLEGLSEAEEIMVKEYIQIFKRLGRMKQLKE